MTADIVMPHCSRRYQVKRCVFSSSHTCIIPSFVINRVYIGSVVSGGYTGIIRWSAVQSTARIVSRRYRKCGIIARPIKDTAINYSCNLCSNISQRSVGRQAKSSAKSTADDLTLGCIKRLHQILQRSNIPILLTGSPFFLV